MQVPLAALTAAVALLLIPSVAHGSTFATESLLLDSYDGSGGEVSGPVTTAQAVPTGTTATVTVRGTFALYTRSLMDASHNPYVICGSSTTAGPLIPSPGLRDAIAGFDAEFVYRRPFVGGCSQTLPIKNSSLQASNGDGGWMHPAEIAASTVPSADHVYRYAVGGTGAPLSFRLHDDFTADNDGVLEIIVSAPSSGDSGATTPIAMDPVFALSSSKSCASRRNFTIHLKTRRGDGAMSAAVRVNGKNAKVVRRRSGKTGFISSIDLRGLPVGTVKVAIVVRTKAGKVLRSERTYHTCITRKSAGA